jgi:hypothetical protein
MTDLSVELFQRLTSALAGKRHVQVILTMEGAENLWQREHIVAADQVSLR